MLAINDSLLLFSPFSRITIVNLNDPPQISLDGEDPVITAFSTNYTEGDGPQQIVSNLFVVDTDPMAIIRRWVEVMWYLHNLVMSYIKST